VARFTLIIGNRNYSSWSLRAWLALKATGADFEEKLVLLGQTDTGEEISRYSPTGLVPALDDGERVIWDSLAIGEYLAEAFPEVGLWPASARLRALARSVVAEMHSGFFDLRSNMPMNIRASYPGEGRAPGVENDIRRILSIWESCRRDFGSDGELLFGHFTLADAFFAPVVSRFRTYGVPVEGLARDYMDAVWNLPAMREWIEKAASEPWTVERYDRELTGPPDQS
jgi:glutathione S-transferase